MKPDDFEKRLLRQPLRQIPGEWRAEILAAARIAAASPHVSRFTFHGFLSSIFWPHPKAWAGLAAVWLVIFSMNFYTAEPATRTARKASPPSPELVLAWQEQRRELAKLIEPAVTLDADKPKSFRASPRSERRDEMLAA